MDWKGMFVSDIPLLEIFIRGSVTYLVLFFLLRFVLKRQSGAVGLNDLLVIVLIADAAQNAMSGGYDTITDGILLVVVIIGWSYLIDLLSFKVPVLKKLFRPPPLLVVKNGKMIKKNMRQEYISEEELKSELRQFGISDLQEVEEMYVESSGDFSVVRKREEDKDESGKPKQKQDRAV